MDNFEIKIITDLKEAEALWEKLSPKISIYDDWSFRRTFHKYYKNELAFYAGYSLGELIGLLPLQKNEKNELEFFGGDYMEDNRVFIKSGREKFVRLFYDALPEKTKLEFISGDDDFTKSLPVVDYKFIFDLQPFKNSTDYISNQYHGETKKKLIKRVKKVTDSGITIIENDFNDIELMFNFNIEQFKDGPIKSMFGREFRQEIFRELLKNNTTFYGRLLTFIVNDEKQAVSMALIYQGDYASINTGLCANPLPNLKEYIHLKKFDDAINVGAKRFDAFVRDYGWKEKWGFKKIPQYEFSK